MLGIDIRFDDQDVPFAIINFYNADASIKAKENANGLEVEDQMLYVALTHFNTDRNDIYQNYQQKLQENVLYIGEIDESISKEELKKILDSFLGIMN